MPRIFLTIAAVGTAIALPLLAQTADTAATTAYKAAMNSMMGDMMMSYSGNPDVDFIKGMVPHHQGAVDNAPHRAAIRHRPRGAQIRRSGDCGPRGRDQVDE